MEKGKISVIKLVLSALAGAIWLATVIHEIIAKYYNSNTTLFILHLICAIVWISAFFVSLRKHLKERNSPD